MLALGLYVRDQKRSELNITQPVLCTNDFILETSCALHAEILESSLYHQAGLAQ